MGRGPEILGRPPGALPRPGRQATGRRSRGPPGRVRRLRGRDPRGQLRGRRGHRVGPGALDSAGGPRRGLEEGQAPLRAPWLQAARRLDARPDEDEGQDDREGMAPHQGARRLVPEGRRRGVPAGVDLLRPDRRGSRLGRRPGGRSPRRARAPRSAETPGARRRRQAHARRAARRRLLAFRVDLGAQVRRLPAARGARRRKARAPLPARDELHGHVSRDRARGRRASIRRVRARRRGRRPRRELQAPLRPSPEARAAPAPPRHRSRRGRAAGDVLRLRPARLRRLRPAAAAAVRPQGPAPAPSARAPGRSGSPTTSRRRARSCSKRRESSASRASSARRPTRNTAEPAPATG